MISKTNAHGASERSNRPLHGISRRGFVAGTVAAGMTLVRAQQVRGAEANSRIEVGLAGLGGRGSLIAQSTADRHPGLQSTSVAGYYPRVANLYVNGIHRNLDKFENEIRAQIYTNDTLERGVNTTLTTLLGRTACLKRGLKHASVFWEIRIPITSDIALFQIRSCAKNKSLVLRSDS